MTPRLVLLAAVLLVDVGALGGMLAGAGRWSVAAMAIANTAGLALALLDVRGATR
jgi:hypothetical protein